MFINISLCTLICLNWLCQITVRLWALGCKAFMIIFLSFIMSGKTTIDVVKTFISSTEPSTKENQLNVRTISSLKRANEPPLNVSSVSMRVNPPLKEMLYQTRAARFGELNSLSLSLSLSLTLYYLKH